MKTSTAAAMSTSSSASEIAKAAGSQSLNRLRDVISHHQWTTHDLNTVRMKAGKLSLHMASWKGCLENVKFLVEEQMCNVNAIATGQHSYGKTPIFFACTQSRNDVVSYLLDQGAHVKILNNKGQSVLSIAASHLEAGVIERIQLIEKQQADMEWENHRATHSDGLEYGDLDPRFAEASLNRPWKDTDVVTQLAVNPTTKASRKGAFARRNPELVKQKKKREAKRALAKPTIACLSPADEHQLDQAWTTLLQSLALTSGSDKSQIHLPALQIIVELSDKRLEAWIPSATARMAEVVPSLTSEVVSQMLIEASSSLTCKDPRISQLLSKWAAYCNREQKEDQSTITINCQDATKREPASPLVLSDDQWIIVNNAVGHIRLKEFENHGPHLRLDGDPRWVSSSCLGLLQQLQEEINVATVVALDSEWYDDFLDSKKTVVRIATLQLATPANVHTPWVLDLLSPCPVFQTKLRSLVQNMLQDESKIVSGFAMDHDIPKLLEWLESNDETTQCTFLDIQRLLSPRKHQLAGLARCCSWYTISDSTLCKQHQCSSWHQRPLTESQLHYAGLDASILLGLLGDYCRQQLQPDVMN